MRVLSWNVRGLRNKQRRASLCRYLSEWEIDCALLQETHLERENGQEWDCFKQSGHSDIVAKGAAGRSGGMAFWWRKSAISVTEIFRDRFLISCRCQSPQGDMEWFISCIYGPCVAAERVGLWEELHAMH
jgi:exonuclease III